MTVVNPKSISGITSITTASGSDNLLTIHTSDANNTERLRIDSTGTTKIVTGIVTTLTATTGIVTTLTANTVTSLGDVDIADKIVHTGDTNTAIRFPSADIISFENGGSETARFSATNQFSVGTTADITGANVSIGGSIRLVNANDRTATISALPSGSYITGHSGGSAIAFHRFSDSGGGSDEIAFETHHQGNRHAESLRIEKTGNIKVNVGNLYFATAGKGIDFAAETPSGAGSANTVLDDYEEGTFTMTMSASSSGTISMSSGIDSLRYTKIGNLVTIHGRVRVESVSSPAGGLQIGGLPFASISSNSNSQDGYQHFGVNTHGVNFHDSTVQLFGELAPNATGAGLFQMFDNSNWAIMAADLIQGNQNEYFGFNFFYHTAT